MYILLFKEVYPWHNRQQAGLNHRCKRVWTPVTLLCSRQTNNNGNGMKTFIPQLWVKLYYNCPSIGRL